MLDLLIRNARICDGTGAPSFMGDLGVTDGLIRTISNGIPNRGVLAEGKVADLVLFDPATVTAKTPKYAYDLPCNGRRLVSESEGIEATFVSGIQLYDKGKHTGAMPGRILRSYE
jgi:N-acyl-D-aspartate/D-glutamate deacylase